MLVEQLIFIVISFALFVLVFLKMVKNNDTTYVIFLSLEAIGIAMSFMEVLFSVQLNTVLKALMYIVSIIIPVLLLVLEKGKVNIIEKINLAKAKFYFNMGNSKKAKQILIDLLEKNDESYKGHKLLAEIYEAEGGMRKAIDEYVQAIDINKQDYDSYYKVAKLLTDLDKKDEASQMLNSLLSKKPDYKEASILLGDLLIEQDMYKEAINVYMEAVKINPLDFDLNYSLGIAYTMINDFQSAKEFYEKAAQINDLIYNCKYSLAEIALIYKELNEAERLFMETIDDDELAPDSYYELSKISLIRGDKEKAILYANTAINLSPKRISEKIKKEAIFIPILARISIPFNLIDDEDEKENEGNKTEQARKLTEKEIKAKEHLEAMFELSRQLGYNDILMMNKSSKGGNSRKQEDEEEKKKKLEELENEGLNAESEEEIDYSKLKYDEFADEFRFINDEEKQKND